MPIGSPSGPTTRTSFARISSLINKSFALILNTPPNLPKQKNCAKRLLRTTETPAKGKFKVISNRCSLGGGKVRTENVLLHFPMYCTTHLLSCQGLFRNFFHFLRPATSGATFSKKICKVVQFFQKNRDFFLTCIFFNEKFDKKSSILNIYKFLFLRYNNKAVGGTNTTASRTTVTCPCEVSSL